MKEIRFADGGNRQIFDAATADDNTVVISGSGSVFTYRLYGANGTTGEVRGGFIGDSWADMQTVCTLVVADPDPKKNPQSAVVQHTWPVLMVNGNIKIARGNA